MAKKFIMTIRLEFDTQEEYSQYFKEHIEKDFLSNSGKVKAIAAYDLFKQLEDIQNLLDNDDIDKYDLIEDIQEVLDTVE